MNFNSIFYATPESGNFFLTCMIRILISVCLGGAIGLERTHRQKGAGIRTHIMISMGATIMMLISKYGFYDVLADGFSADPSRIASNIMTGMGFIGAGVIFVKNTSIKGLTTAAGLWTTSGIAMAIGAGMYWVGIFAAAIMLLLQIVLHVCLRTVDTAGCNELTIVIANRDQSFTRLKEQLASYQIVVEGCKFKREEDRETIRVVAKISSNISAEELLSAAAENPDILSIEI